MPENESQSRRAARLIPAAVVLIAAVAAYGAITNNALHNGRLWFDEVAYLIKSWWYVTGVVAPYTATDATGAMPLYFYQLGEWQSVARVSHVMARMMSIGLGLVSAVLLFAIVRRLTANMLAAAAAVLLFLATPTTAFYFATATPAATVSALHLAAIWLIVSGLGRPRIWATILFGLLCVAMFFYRQNMILAVVVLAPLYIAAIGRARANHAAILVVVIGAAAAAILYAFPATLAAYALRLPVISPTLERAGILPPDFALIDQGTQSTMTMGPAFGAVHIADVVNAFLLPFAGTIILAAALFVVAGRGLRILWIAPLYFFFLAAAHIFGEAGYCGTCIMTYTNYFVGTGAIAAALTLAVFASVARRQGVSAGAVIIIGTVIGVAMNVFAPALATTEDTQFFPVPMLTPARPLSEASEIDSFAHWLAITAPQNEPILLIHNLPSLPYAVFKSGHAFPVQNINPTATHRVIKPRLPASAREGVQAAVEAQTLWTDDTQKRWLERDYDLVLLQEIKDADQSAIVATIAQHFDLVATNSFRGANVSLYKRKAGQ